MTNFRTGMTLIELMVSIALSAMLMSAVIGVVSGTAKQAKIAEQREFPVWPERTIELIRRDLIAANSVWRSGNAIWLRTDAPAYGSDNKGIRNVSYRTRKLESGAKVLERTDSSEISLLALNVWNIRLERIDRLGVPQPLPPTPGPVPVQVRVWIRLDGKSQSLLVRDLVLR